MALQCLEHRDPLFQSGTEGPWWLCPCLPLQSFPGPFSSHLRGPSAQPVFQRSLQEGLFSVTLLFFPLPANTCWTLPHLASNSKMSQRWHYQIKRKVKQQLRSYSLFKTTCWIITPNSVLGQSFPCVWSSSNPQNCPVREVIRFPYLRLRNWGSGKLVACEIWTQVSCTRSPMSFLCWWRLWRAMLASAYKFHRIY